MTIVRINDGIIKNETAGNTQLGGYTNVKTSSLIIVGPHSEQNQNTIYLRKTGGSVAIPVNPSEILSLTRPDNSQFNLGQWEILTKQDDDSCGYIAFSFVIIDESRDLVMLADFTYIMDEWPTTFTFGGSTFTGYLGEVSEDSSLEVGGIVPEYDADVYCKNSDFSTPLAIGDVLTVTASFDSLLVGNEYRVHTRGLSDGNVIQYGLKALNE